MSFFDSIVEIEYNLLCTDNIDIKVNSVDRVRRRNTLVGFGGDKDVSRVC